MKKPSLVIALALLRTYGLRKGRSEFMCIAIGRLRSRGIINHSEMKEAREAVMELVHSYDPYAKTLAYGLSLRGQLKSHKRAEKIKQCRRMYIKYAFQLFRKGL